MSQWIKVSDRLPDVPSPRKIHDGFWVYRPNARNELYRVYWETLHPTNWKEDGIISEAPITHWLDWKIPEPPEVD